MITVYDHNNDPSNLYTMADIANEVGLAHHTIRHRVKVAQTLPCPTVRHGRRLYYSETAYNKILAKHFAAQTQTA